MYFLDTTLLKAIEAASISRQGQLLREEYIP